MDENNLHSIETQPTVENSFVPVKQTERIGPYRLARELGRGGMGSVYLAHRDDDELLMSVCIKLIRADRTSPAMIKRFRKERQLLADLRHPHIASFLDAGTTDEGQPYLIMEFIEGDLISYWNKQHKPKIPQLLDLFAKLLKNLRN